MTEAEQKLQEFLLVLKGYFPDDVTFDLKYRRQENEYRVHISTKSTESMEMLCQQEDFLQSLQYILWLVYRKHHKEQDPALISVDATEMRKTYLLSLADKLAQQSIEMNKPISVPPLNSFERRMIHEYLSHGKKVQTESVGDGRLKKIIISPL